MDLEKLQKKTVERNNYGNVFYSPKDIRKQINNDIKEEFADRFKKYQKDRSDNISMNSFIKNSQPIRTIKFKNINQKLINASYLSEITKEDFILNNHQENLMKDDQGKVEPLFLVHKPISPVKKYSHRRVYSNNQEKIRKNIHNNITEKKTRTIIVKRKTNPNYHINSIRKTHNNRFNRFPLKKYQRFSQREIQPRRISTQNRFQSKRIINLDTYNRKTIELDPINERDKQLTFRKLTNN